VSGLWQDVHYGLRSLRKSPGFATAALLMLALGTGANAAMFSVVDAVIVRSAFRDPERVVELLDRHRPGVESALWASPDELRRFRGMTDVFDSVSAGEFAQPTLTGVGEPRTLLVECVSASLFRVVGVQPVAGRAFREDEDQPGADPVIVISDRLSQQVFGGGVRTLGQSLVLDGHPVTVIGVMAADFDGAALRSPDALAPLGQGVGQASTAGCHVGLGTAVYARIRSDLTLGSAQTRLQAMTGGTRGLVSLDEANLADHRATLLMLLGAVSFVLLIACANVANLLLGRAVLRRREIATRLALGASPGRLVRQMLTESVLLATLGAFAGLVAARLVLGTLVALLPLGLPHVSHIALNARVFLVAVAAGVLAGLLAGLVPAVQASSRGLAVWMHDARAVTLPSRSWARRTLVVTEVALSVGLLVGAALTMRSFLTLRPTHPGFDASNKIVAAMRLSAVRYPSAASRLAFLEALTSRLAGLPGVRGVSVVSIAPFSGMTDSQRITVTGRPDLDDGHVVVDTSEVTANYFDEMRMSITRGRGFLPTDDARALPVAIVSETLARRVWPGGDPIGAVITPRAETASAARRLVVGVASDIRTSGGSTRPSAELYVPMAQDPSPEADVIVRTGDAGPGNLASEIRHEAAVVDATQVVTSVTPFEEILAGSQGGRRFVTWLMGTFAAMALGLAVLGLTAVIGASVAQRTREIGIRMTLGARPGAVVRLVLRQAILLTGCGVVMGLFLAVATTRFLANSLYGVTPLDRPTFAASAALMLVVAMAASYVPARRATKVDPLVALRFE
jgi:putative ABC transport system permease protein